MVVDWMPLEAPVRVCKVVVVNVNVPAPEPVLC